MECLILFAKTASIFHTLASPARKWTTENRHVGIRNIVSSQTCLKFQTHTGTHTNAHTDTHMHTYRQTHIQKHTRTHTLTYTHMHRHAHIQTHTHEHTYAHIDIHVYTYRSKGGRCHRHEGNGHCSKSNVCQCWKPRGHLGSAEAPAWATQSSTLWELMEGLSGWSLLPMNHGLMYKEK